MKRDFLHDLGIEKDVIDKIMAENGKDVEAQKLKTTEAIAEKDGLQGQLADVQSKLAAFDGVDVADLKGQVKALSDDMAAKEAAHQTELQGIAMRHAVEVRLSKEEFTSEYARKGVMEELLGKGLKLDGGQVLGLEDAVKTLVESTPDAFKAKEDPNPNPLGIGLPPAGNGGRQSGDRVIPRVI